MAGAINKTMKNKILSLHAAWLFKNGYYDESIDCLNQATDLKRTSVHVKPRASLCTATYEAASTVEVWSLCSYRSTCTETIRVNMNNKLKRSCGYTSKPDINLVLINFHSSNLFHFILRLFVACLHTVIHTIVLDGPFIRLQTSPLNIATHN